MLIPSWRPKKRNVHYAQKPDDIPEWVYTQAVAAKRMYNENWEFWVWNVSMDYNCSQAEAEDACIRGIKKEFLRYKLVYGDKIGDWFERYMDMSDLFTKVKLPEFQNKLGDS